MLITKPAGLIVFALVDEHKGMSINELSALLEIDRGAIQIALNYLIEQEIIKQKGSKAFYCLAKY